MAGLGDGYGIEDSNVDWKVLDPEEVKDKKLDNLDEMERD